RARDANDVIHPAARFRRMRGCLRAGGGRASVQARLTEPALDNLGCKKYPMLRHTRLVGVPMPTDTMSRSLGLVPRIRAPASASHRAGQPADLNFRTVRPDGR